MSAPAPLCHSILIAALIGWTGAEAVSYRWTDENGQTVYSQTPPPSGDAVRIENPAAPDPADAERERRELRERIEQSYDRDVERDELQAKQAEEGRHREQRAKNCQTARQNLTMLENLGRRMVRTPDGDYVRPSEEERESQMRKARAEIDEFCD